MRNYLGPKFSGQIWCLWVGISEREVKNMHDELGWKKIKLVRFFNFCILLHVGIDWMLK